MCERTSKHADRNDSKCWPGKVINRLRQFISCCAQHVVLDVFIRGADSSAMKDKTAPPCGLSEQQHESVRSVIERRAINLRVYSYVDTRQFESIKQRSLRSGHACLLLLQCSAYVGCNALPVHRPALFNATAIFTFNPLRSVAPSSVNFNRQCRRHDNGGSRDTSASSSFGRNTG